MVWGPARAIIEGVKTYGQYCPIARTSELLAERWTILIIRNLLNGCRTFSDIRAGLPGIPPALLTQRLAGLERHSVIVRTAKPKGRGFEFTLTERGRELQEVCDAMGRWGARWLEVEPQHMDPGYALWATAKLVDPSKLPARRVVVRFEVRDRPGKRFWMLVQPEPEVCSAPPGFNEDLIVRTDAACLADINLRRTTVAAAQRTGRLEMQGPPGLARGFATWFRPSPYAGIRPAKR